MTALARYDVLEAVGWYAEHAGDEPREVLVTFGVASLTILRFDEAPLAHWPLGSLVEVSGAAPQMLTLAPDADAPERLTLSDVDMISAIRAVSPAGGGSSHRRNRRRRSRPWRRLVVVALAALGALSVWAATPLLAEKLAARTPQAARAALGDAAIAAFSGAAACDTVKGRRALVALAQRLANAAQDGPVVLRVVDTPAVAAAALPAPGGRIVLFRETVAAAGSPRDLAVAAAEAMAQAKLRSPTAVALAGAGAAGLRGALTRDLRAAGLTAAAAEALRAPALAQAELSAQQAARILAALDADPSPLLTSAQFAAIQSICGGA